MWVCSRKVKAVLLAAFVPFLSLVMLDLCRNSDGNKTSTHYKAIIQFWGHSISDVRYVSIYRNIDIFVQYRDTILAFGCIDTLEWTV